MYAWILCTSFWTYRCKCFLKVFECHCASLIQSDFLYRSWHCCLLRYVSQEFTNGIHSVVNTAVWVHVVRKWDFQGLSNNRPVQHADMVLVDEEVCFPCSTTPTHKLNLYKATMLVPLCYIFRIPFILYIIISSMTCVGSRFCIHLIYNEYTMLYTWSLQFHGSSMYCVVIVNICIKERKRFCIPMLTVDLIFMPLTFLTNLC
jgi:hypothetical protein